MTYEASMYSSNKHSIPASEIQWMRMQLTVLKDVNIKTFRKYVMTVKIRVFKILVFNNLEGSEVIH